MSEHGSIAWSDDVELCEDARYMALTGKSAEELFRVLRICRRQIRASNASTARSRCAALVLDSGPPMLELSTCCGTAPLE